ncbi:hypothetical protein ACEZCY_28095 [Streptacidiphilus sp. N1-12]|uniref:Immunity protein Imm1 n=2 Tax=Streptacidiphilus alkalitolerans TaxID=3342712 RepID=A0ABV6WLZ4_9ACTN
MHVEAPDDAPRNRRIAEIFELLDLDDVALHWWSRAALLGDRDAADYLEVLRQDQDTPEDDHVCYSVGDDVSPSDSFVIVPDRLAGVEDFAATFIPPTATSRDRRSSSAAMRLLEGCRKAYDTREADGPANRGASAEETER